MLFSYGFDDDILADFVAQFVALSHIKLFSDTSHIQASRRTRECLLMRCVVVLTTFFLPRSIEKFQNLNNSHSHRTKPLAINYLQIY